MSLMVGASDTIALNLSTSGSSVYNYSNKVYFSVSGNYGST